MSPLKKYISKMPVWVSHLAVWLSYTFFIYITNVLYRPGVTFLQVLLFQLPFFTVFYLGLYSLDIYRRKGILTGLIVYFLIFFMMASLAYLYIYILLPKAGMTLYSSSDFRLFLGNAILGYFQFTVYAVLYFKVQQSLSNERNLRHIQEEKSKLEKMKIQQELENALLKERELISQQEKLQFEYAFLRSQINPHFLHNTLNVLYSQAIKVSEGLADNILKLSEMMRYSLTGADPENSTVYIQDELDQLQNLLDIHTLRFGQTKSVRLVIKGVGDGHTIPPLSLITVVENAFKYGDLKDPEHPLTILVRFSPDSLYFFCRNKKRASVIQPPTLNIGIANLSKRLEAAFDDRYEIRSRDGENFYTFELTVNYSQ